MAQFDPALKKETWIFRKNGEQGGNPVWERLKFNLVHYDDSPDGDIEPVNDFQFSTGDGAEPDVLDYTSQLPRVANFDFLFGHNANPYFELHRFD